MAQAAGLTGSARPAAEVLLFDLGGVLVELGPRPLPPGPAGGARDFDSGDWLASATAHAFEKGVIGAPEFAQALIDEYGLDCSRRQLLEHFTRWPRGLYDGAGQLLRSLRRDHRLAVLTNTNELHWPRLCGEFGLARLVDDLFASHQLGMAKPEPAIFAHVAAALGVDTAQILYFDDNRANVEAAAKMGFRARQARGPAQLKALLRAEGIAVADR